MNLVSANLASPWLWAMWGVALLLAGVVFRRASWRMLLNQANLNVFLGATVVVLALWLIKTGVRPGLNFHLLGATALTLMFRPMFALLAMALVTLAMSLWNGEIATFAANWLIMGALPVGLSWVIFRWVDGRLPNHFFIYIFLNAFVGGGLAILGVGLVSSLFSVLAGAYTLNYLVGEYLPYYLLMAWSEAFSTGMAMTVLVVYRPDWVSTFDDARYLRGK